MQQNTFLPAHEATAVSRKCVSSNFSLMQMEKLLFSGNPGDVSFCLSGRTVK
jgi:hypothetical protein